MCDHPTQLTSHKRIIHEEKLEPLECAHCPLQVRTQPELDKHLRNIHRYITYDIFEEVLDLNCIN